MIDDRSMQATASAFSGGVLTPPHASGTTVDQLVFTGSLSAADFALTSDAHGGTDITYVPPAASQLGDAGRIGTADTSPAGVIAHIMQR